MMIYLDFLFQIGSSWINLVQVGSIWFKLDQFGLNWINLVIVVQKWSIWIKLDQVGSSWIKLIQVGSNWFKLFKIDQIGSNFSERCWTFLTHVFHVFYRLDCMDLTTTKPGISRSLCWSNLQKYLKACLRAC